MTSQTGTQITAIWILPNIWRHKGNQTMKFGQVMEHNIKNRFLQNHLETKTRRLFPEPFSFFQKALYEIKVSGQHRTFNMFGSPQLNNKRASKLVLRHILWVVFLEKHFSCYILLAEQVSLSDSFYILRHKAICVL